MELKPGYKQSDVGIIPNDWNVKTLKVLSEKIMVGIASSATHAYREKGVVLFRNQNIKSGFLDDSDILFISPQYEITFANKRLKEGDLLTARTGYPGTTCIVPSKYIGAQSFTTLITRPQNDLITTEFLCHYINSENGQKFFELNQIGGGQKNVNAGTLEIMPIIFPADKHEQTAIAQALSDTDELISSLDKLITKKHNIKQGAMQQLLTGKKRLPGFTGEWVTKKLGEIAEIKKGQLITEKTTLHGSIPVIGGGISPSYYHNLANRKPNTITISASGANAGYVAFHNYKIFASDCSTIEESSDYDVKYIYFSLLQRQYEIFKLQTGGAQPHVYPEQLRSLEIFIPKSKLEQSTIAQILSDMDSEIETLEKKRDKYKAIKQGMMQELLTGKTRLI